MCFLFPAGSGNRKLGCKRFRICLATEESARRRSAAEHDVADVDSDVVLSGGPCTCTAAPTWGVVAGGRALEDAVGGDADEVGAGVNGGAGGGKTSVRYRTGPAGPWRPLCGRRRG